MITVYFRKIKTGMYSLKRRVVCKIFFKKNELEFFSSSKMLNRFYRYILYYTVCVFLNGIYK